MLASWGFIASLWDHKLAKYCMKWWRYRLSVEKSWNGLKWNFVLILPLAVLSAISLIEGSYEVSAFPPLSHLTLGLSVSPGQVTPCDYQWMHILYMSVCVRPILQFTRRWGRPHTTPSPVCDCGKSEITLTLELPDAVQEAGIYGVVIKLPVAIN